jgi:hypothetical protein
MATTLPSRHVLVWVDAEFLESEGMLHILKESGVITGGEQDWEKLVAAAEDSGGFALGAILVESHHGAALSTPSEMPGLARFRGILCAVSSRRSIFKMFG